MHLKILLVQSFLEKARITVGFYDIMLIRLYLSMCFEKYVAWRTCFSYYKQHGMIKNYASSIFTDIAIDVAARTN